MKGYCTECEEIWFDTIELHNQCLFLGQRNMGEVKKEIQKFKKKFVRTILYNIVFMCFSFSLVGQDSLQITKKNTIIKIDLFPISLWLISPNFRNMVSLSVENTTFKNQSIQLTTAYRLYNVNKNIDYVIQTTLQKTLQIILEYKFYILFKKLYIGQYSSYSYKRLYASQNEIYYQLYREMDVIQHSISGGGLTGYQLFIKKRTSLDFRLGLGIRKIISEKIIIGDLYAGIGKSINLDSIFSITLGYSIAYK